MQDKTELNNKKIKVEYSNLIKNKTELLNQLRSLRDESLNNSYLDPIFKKDYTALIMAIDIIKKAII